MTPAPTRPHPGRRFVVLAVLLAFAVLFAPGSRDLPFDEVPATVGQLVADVLRPTVSHGDAWERPRVEAVQHHLQASPGGLPTLVLGLSAAAVALLAAQSVLALRRRVASTAPWVVATVRPPLRAPPLLAS